MALVIQTFFDWKHRILHHDAFFDNAKILKKGKVIGQSKSLKLLYFSEILPILPEILTLVIALKFQY